MSGNLLFLFSCLVSLISSRFWDVLWIVGPSSILVHCFATKQWSTSLQDLIFQVFFTFLRLIYIRFGHSLLPSRLKKTLWWWWMCMWGPFRRSALTNRVVSLRSTSLSTLFLGSTSVKWFLTPFLVLNDNVFKGFLASPTALLFHRNCPMSTDFPKVWHLQESILTLLKAVSCHHQESVI